MIKALFKFANAPNYKGLDIDTTSNSGQFKQLSPFILRCLEPTTGKSVIFENLWQFSKVYKRFDGGDKPLPEWYMWRADGWFSKQPHRYPMGKGATPEYSYWQGEKLGYIEARKKIYAPIYAQWVSLTDSFKTLLVLYNSKQNIILRDFDAYDYEALGMTLKDVINNPKRKMGHAFVLIMMLKGELESCIKPESLL